VQRLYEQKEAETDKLVLHVEDQLVFLPSLFDDASTPTKNFCTKTVFRENEGQLQKDKVCKKSICHISRH
jgi:hypothetical protein